MSRRWEAIFYLVTEPSSRDGIDRIVTLPPSIRYPQRGLQYRVIFDPDKQAWRVDIRSDVLPT